METDERQVAECDQHPIPLAKDFGASAVETPPILSSDEVDARFYARLQQDRECLSKLRSFNAEKLLRKQRKEKVKAKLIELHNRKNDVDVQIRRLLKVSDNLQRDINWASKDKDVLAGDYNGALELGFIKRKAVKIRKKVIEEMLREHARKTHSIRSEAWYASNTGMAGYKHGKTDTQ